ncbi:tyrosine-type recombinase/integrase [Alcanivorax sp. 1008]|uniref:tyrosine-type recombinase/integrase n=1 Tax=Alcanivorax sp. 1008 TaxID=2816853 RepID=UPI001DA344A4|nr:tyrosine-type recombinase/integrase [Alcanivorax sp. 1008]MCC1496782.1 tyrosine-type recombinase/integrase [Alcanivorax sp. 1008]
MTSSSDRQGSVPAHGRRTGLTSYVSADRDELPSVAYIQGLKSLTSRRKMEACLNIACWIMRGPAHDAAIHHSQFQWSQLRASHIDLVIEFLRRTPKSSTAHFSQLAPSGGVEWPQIAKSPDKVPLGQRRSAATIRAYLTALKAVAGEALVRGIIDQGQYQLIRRVRYAKARSERQGRRLTPAEVKALFIAADPDESLIGRRDAALIAVLLGCGIRRAELSSLMVDSYDPRSSTLTVIGKGDKTRRVFLVKECEVRLQEWLSAYRNAVIGDMRSSPLFPRIHKNGLLGLEALTGDGVYYILGRRARSIGLDAFSPHDLRRTFATVLLENGNDLGLVRDAMGHADVSTTQIYDQRSDERIKEAVSSLKFS